MNGGPPKRCIHALNPVNVTLFGKGATADIIKDLKMRSSWIIQVVPKSKEVSLQEGEEGKTHRREDSVMMEEEVGVMQPQAKESQVPPEARKRQGRVLPQTPEGRSLANTLIAHFWSPEPGDNTFLLFEATLWVISCDNGPRKLIQSYSLTA